MLVGGELYLKGADRRIRQGAGRIGRQRVRPVGDPESGEGRRQGAVVGDQTRPSPAPTGTPGWSPGTVPAAVAAGLVPGITSDVTAVLTIAMSGSQLTAAKFTLDGADGSAGHHHRAALRAERARHDHRAGVTRPPAGDRRRRRSRAAGRAGRLRGGRRADRHGSRPRHPGEPAGTGHADRHRLPARLRRRDAAARPAVRPVRPPAGAAVLPGRVRGRDQPSPPSPIVLPLLVAGRVLQGHGRRRAAAGHDGAGRRPVAGPPALDRARLRRRRPGAGQRAGHPVRGRDWPPPFNAWRLHRGSASRRAGGGSSGSTCR